MDGMNHSTISEFVFLGVTNSWEIQLLLFVFSFLLYLASMMGNLVIVFTVTLDACVHSPMYFLLANLEVIDMFFCSITAPEMIYDIFKVHKAISFCRYSTQISFSHDVGGTEMVLLIAMVFDRYAALCQPLHYLTNMSSRMCLYFLVTSWVIGFICSLAQLIFGRFAFCDPNVLDSFYCALPWLLRLA